MKTSYLNRDLKGIAGSIVFFGVAFIFASVAEGQVGISLGNEYGFGLTARAGVQAAQIEVGGGIVPFLVFVDVIPGGSITKVYFPGTVGGKLSLSLSKSEDQNRFGIKFGVSYNTIIRTGIGGGIDYRVGGSPQILVSFGLMVYPDAEEQVRRRINEDERADFSPDQFSAPLAKFQLFAGLSVLLGK